MPAKRINAVASESNFLAMISNEFELKAKSKKNFGKRKIHVEISFCEL
jgi:hypothetical protein